MAMEISPVAASTATVSLRDRVNALTARRPSAEELAHAEERKHQAERDDERQKLARATGYGTRVDMYL